MHQLFFYFVRIVVSQRYGRVDYTKQGGEWTSSRQRGDILLLLLLLLIVIIVVVVIGIGIVPPLLLLLLLQIGDRFSESHIKDSSFNSILESY